MKKLLFLILTAALLSGCSLFEKEISVENDSGFVGEDVEMKINEDLKNRQTDFNRACTIDDDCKSRRVNCGNCRYEFACVNAEVESCELDPSERENCPGMPSPWFTNCKCHDSACVECKDEECGNPFLL
jgi:hypothetical protein